MKPSNLFHDDNSSSKYWSFRWSKSCMGGAKSQMSLRQLAKLVILSILLVGLGYLVIAWLSPHSSPTTLRTAIDQEMIVNFNKNLSITNSSMTEESSAEITRSQKASTPQPPSTRDDEHVNADDVLLTKQYVSLFRIRALLCDF